VDQPLGSFFRECAAIEKCHAPASRQGDGEVCSFNPPRRAEDFKMSSDNQQSTELHVSRALPLLLILFAGSGCSALIYEIVWYQLLQFVIGSTAVSLGVLLATFMGGLCLGSMAMPRILTMRRHHPLRVYAAIEMGIGFCGILVLFGMPLVSRMYVTSLGHGLPSILLRATICAICLLPPTTLMGASLPAIARWIGNAPRHASWLGLLYASNTAGAVFGCFLAGFYLLRIFDMAIATYFAAAINTAVAAISFGLVLGLAPSSMLRTPIPADFDAPREERAATGSRLWPVYTTIALSGACALGAEVVWTRLLGPMLGATVYTFSIILAVFLVGLALGSGAGSLLSLVVRPQAAMGYCQLLLTAAIAWTAFMLAKSLPYWPIDPKLASSPWFTFQIDLVRVVWALWPGTLLWGATFTLALAAVASDDRDPARAVGNVYAANTGGAIVGALAFSMLLIPRIGTRNAERALIALSAVGALCILVPMVWSRREKIGDVCLAVSILAAALLLITVPGVPATVIAYGRLSMTAGESQILYVGEGMNSSIAVSQYGSTREFHVSGKAEASNNAFDMRVQRMLGDMPAVLHPNPRRVLVVGFGAGVTAGSFVVNPDVQRIVVCEIEPLVPPATSQYFNKENYNVLHDARTEIVYDDARSYILSTPEMFDIITSDPIHPWVRGSATLYTKEYFEMARAHLNPGGIVAQWVPLYETDSATVKSEIATFFDVFPNGTVWANEDEGGGYDVMLLGQKDPLQINVIELQKRLERPEYARVARSLRDVGLSSAAEILGTYAGQASDLKPWLNGAAINRDGNLRLQYLAGLALNQGREDAIYQEMLTYRRFPANLIVGTAQEIQAVGSGPAGSDPTH
jgi:spermidine synthase